MNDHNMDYPITIKEEQLLSAYTPIVIMTENPVTSGEDPLGVEKQIILKTQKIIEEDSKDRSKPISITEGTFRPESGSKLFICYYCGFTSDWRRLFVNHISNHLSRYACDLCNFKTTRSDYLKRHMKTHSVYKPIYHHTTKSKEINSVENLIKNSNNLTIEDKIRIKNAGPPRPNLIINAGYNRKGKTFIRKFQIDTYKRNSWICGCEIRNKLFCFPCLLMSNKSNNKEITWTLTGTSDLSHLSQKIRKHSESISHSNSVIDFEVFGKQEILVQLNPVDRQNIVKHNDNVRRNRHILSQIINCIKFCGAFELTSKESDRSNNSGIFKGLINFTAELDVAVKEHLKNVNEATSGDLQNDLLDCILHVCRSQIMKEIDNASFVSIITDEITDTSKQFQFVIVFRYVLENGQPVERFWTFCKPSLHSADSFADSIKTELDEVIKSNITKLVSQSYDGVDIMSGQRAGVQAIIKTHYPFAYLVHCYAHQLDLIMAQACRANAQARVFLSDISDIADFFTNSTQRTSILNETVGRKIPDFSFTNWNLHSRIIQIVHENYATFIECFLQIELTSHQTNTIIQARGLRLKLEQPIFKFWLELFFKIIPRVDILSEQLQKHSTDPTEVFKAVKIFENSMSSIRYEINSIANRHGFNSPLLQKNHKPDPFLNKSAKEICDNIISEMSNRFQFSTHLLITKLLDSQNFPRYQIQFPDDIFKTVCNAYPFFNVNKLKIELQVLYMRQDLREVKGAVSLLKFFIENNLKYQLNEICQLLSLFITIPMVTAEAERNFLTLERIKSFLRSTHTEARLNALAMLSIEKELIKNISNFNEQVIDSFAFKNDRIDLMYNKTVSGVE